MRTDQTIAEVDSFLQTLPDPVRQVARGEWGFTVQAAGWPLDVGIAVRDGLFRVQAQVVGPGQISEADLLWWNRRIHLVRFSQTQSGEVWLCCDLLPDSLSARQLDRVLGLFVLTAAQARATVTDEPLPS